MAESSLHLEESQSVLHSNWSPEAPAGLNFKNVIPDDFGAGYRALPTESEQKELKTKMRSSRLTSRRHSKVLRTCAGLNFLGEKRFREAANNGNCEMIERLIAEGVAVCCADSKKRTALHFAAARGDVATVQALLNHGANPNLKDVNGNTPLHLAACASHIKIVTVLLEHGASVNALDECGQSPLQLAFARLRLIEGDEIAHSTARTFKTVVMEVVKMLQIYLSKVGHVMDEEQNLDDLCHKLAKTTSIEQVQQYKDSFIQYVLSARGLCINVILSIR